LVSQEEVISREAKGDLRRRSFEASVRMKAWGERR